MVHLIEVVADKEELTQSEWMGVGMKPVLWKLETAVEGFFAAQLTLQHQRSLQLVREVDAVLVSDVYIAAVVVVIAAVVVVIAAVVAVAVGVVASCRAFHDPVERLCY